MAIGLKHDGNGKVLELRDSVDGVIYPTQPNAVVWHDQNSTNEVREYLLRLIKNDIPKNYLKWNIAKGEVSEMSQAEKDAVDAEEAARIKQQTIDRIMNLDVTSIEVVKGLSRLGIIPDEAAFIDEIKKYRMVDK